MAVPPAEDDRLLLGPAGRKELVKKAAAHRGDPLGHQETVFEARGVVMLAGFLLRQGLACPGVDQFFPREVLARDAAFALVDILIVMEEVEAADLAGRQVAVLDTLRHVVFVDRLAEPA